MGRQDVKILLAYEVRNVTILYTKNIAFNVNSVRLNRPVIGNNKTNIR